jgi:hypothetical protein
MTPDEREGGYIKLWRRLRSSPLWRSMNAGQRVVWIEVLFAANWKEDEFWYGTKRIIVKRGQFAHSEYEIARRAKVGRQVVRSTFALLVTAEAITRETSQLGNRAPTITTIVNYERYQGTDDNGNQQNNPSPTQAQPKPNPSPTLREEVEEYEEEEEVKDLARSRCSALGGGGPDDLFKLPPAGSDPPGTSAAPPASATGDGGTAPPPPPKLRKCADPRFAPLRAAFEAEFLAVTGQAYRWQGAKDAKAIHRLISVPVEEFRAKAQVGLKANGFVRSPTVAQLAAKWNDITAAAPADHKLAFEPAYPDSAFTGGERPI